MPALPTLLPLRTYCKVISGSNCMFPTCSGRNDGNSLANTSRGLRQPTLLIALWLTFLLPSDDAHAGPVIDYIRDYDLNDYALGVAFSSSQNAYAGGGDSLFAYPYLTSFRHSAFTDDWLLVRNENVGFRYITESDWELGVVGRVQTLGLGSSELSTGLEERNWALESGPLVGWRRWPVHAQFRTYWEIPNRHSGSTSELELSLPLEFSRGFFVPSVLLKHMSSAYSDYYFGVGESESAPGSAPYEPGATLYHELRFSLGYELTPRWLLKAALGVEILDSAITDSPIVDKDHLWSGSIGLAYNANVFQAKDFEGSSRPGSLMIRLAAFNSNVATEVRRDSSSGNPGTQAEFEEFLGAGAGENVLQAEVYYRIGYYHRLKAGYFEIDRKLRATLGQDFVFGDEIFSAGTQVASKFDTRRFGLLYGYSLMRDAQKELGVQAGITFTRIQLDVVAEETQQAERVTVNAPLPTMGVFGSLALGERWELGADTGIFALDFDHYSGYAGHASLTLDRAVGETFAIGLGYDYYVSRLESRGEDLRGLLRSHNHGPKMYFSWIF